MVVIANSGAVTSGVTETDITVLTSNNVFVLNINFANMRNGSNTDIVILNEYGKVRASDSEGLIKTYTLVGAQSEVIFQSIPRISNHWLRYTIRQSNFVSSTSNVYPWAVYVP